MEKKLLLAVLVIAVVAASAATLWDRSNPGTPEGGGGGDSQGNATVGHEWVVRRALVYDSLSSEFPNDELIEDIVSLLEAHGVEVDVVRGYNASLDPLVAMGMYDLVILRAHGAYNGDPESGRPLGAYIYTGLTLPLAMAVYGDFLERGLDEGLFATAVIPRPGVPLEDLPKYIAVSPLFIEEQVGRMNWTIVFFTGCYGFNDDRLANAFLSRGAGFFAAWRGNVTLYHADAFTEAFVEGLVERGWDPVEAFEYANQTIGPDPATGAVALYVVRGGGGQG